MDILFWKNPWKFYVCYFTLGNSALNKISPLEILRNCVTPLRDFKAKKQDTGDPTLIVLSTPGNSISFSINLWHFHILFLLYPWIFGVLNHLCLDFSGIAQWRLTMRLQCSYKSYKISIKTLIYIFRILIMIHKIYELRV